MKPHDINKWKTTDSAKIYENQWISVREDKTINPSGGAGIYGVVSFKNYAIGIIPIDAELNTYVVGQWRYALNIYSWEIPMGGGPRSQDVEQSARRELLEETGLIADKLTLICTLHTSNSVTDETGFVYVATGLTKGETHFDPTEDLGIEKIPFTKLFEMVMDGTITDAITVAGVLKLKMMIDNQLVTF